MKLEQIKESSTDVWGIVVKDGKKDDEVFVLDTRGQVYAFIRAARMLGFKDEQLTIRRKMQAEYSFAGE